MKFSTSIILLVVLFSVISTSSAERKITFNFQQNINFPKFPYIFQKKKLKNVLIFQEKLERAQETVHLVSVQLVKGSSAVMEMKPVLEHKSAVKKHVILLVKTPFKYWGNGSRHQIKPTLSCMHL